MSYTLDIEYKLGSTNQEPGAVSIGLMKIDLIGVIPEMANPRIEEFVEIKVNLRVVVTFEKIHS